METSDLRRHQIIKSLMAEPNEKVADAAIDLWERLAAQIISIVGDEGFSSLYARCIFLSRSKYPWLSVSQLTPSADRQFAELKTSLEGQTPAQASEANSLLLINFTNILASLIGEQLTTRILGLAWGIDTSNSTNSIDMELQK
ncbi:MAG: hypothetical protein ABI363_05520 [Nitrosospira sp.]